MKSFRQAMINISSRVMGNALRVAGVAGLLYAAPARAAVLNVAPEGAPFRTVVDALRAARPGDTIRVSAGVYEGDLLLDRTLVLEGKGKPVIRGSGRTSTITITAPSCEVRGFIIEHCGADLQKEDSGILLRSPDNRIEDNELRDILYGIYLYRAGGNRIRRNLISGRKFLESGERGAGLHLWDSPDNIIEHNTITEARDGLYIQSSPGATIRHNRVYNLRYGVHYMFSDKNNFEDNVFAYCMAGAAIMYSRTIEFRRNAFIHNRGFSSFGILFQECEHCLSERNLIVDNTTGIFMEALRDSEFHDNVIGENDVALEMFSSASGNLFWNNNFVSNLSPLLLIGRTTTTRWELNGRGNYWSDYGGYDLDHDGIGDVPHKIQNVFDYMEGNFPRLRLYLESPAAQGLALAERLFPVVVGSREIDRAPLVHPVAVEAALAGAPMSARWPLGLLSAVMLGAGVAVVLWGQRR